MEKLAEIAINRISDSQDEAGSRKVLQLELAIHHLKTLARLELEMMGYTSEQSRKQANALGNVQD